MRIYKNKKTIQVDDIIVSSNNNEYDIMEYLGGGGNGSVYSCLDRHSGIEYAIKLLPSSSEKSKKRFEQEIQLMKLTKHPHLINYIDEGTVKGYNPIEKSYTDIKYVIMERADGNLFDYVKKNNNIQYKEYAPQFRGLSGALAELHKYAIHRDIKPENILIRGNTWVLTDFGLCEFTSPELHCDITEKNEKIGPRYWMSPEAINSVLFETDEIKPYSDVFQLCSVFAFVLTHRYPGGILTDNDINTTDAIKKIIKDSLSYDVKHRPNNGKVLFERFLYATERQFL